MAKNSAQLVRRTNPEVLAPAGKLDTLKTAIDFGADAVYCGGQAFGMRSSAKNLSLEEIEEGTKYAHERGARIYITCNVLPKSEEVADMNQFMASLDEIGVDALIISDIGVLLSARKYAPHTDLHISTQAGVTNYQAANALAELGASRVVVARELDLAALRQIRANVPETLEIEAFVHGAMCMAFSGRCLISQHTTGRDANHGDCAQSCRWKYHVVEEKRPGQFFPVEVTNNGTFLFNSQDMNMLEHVDDVLDAGVTSLKIEGRAKGAYYVAAMANAYKTAVNCYMQQRGYEDEQGNQLKPYRPIVKDEPQPKVQLPEWLIQEPDKVAHRQYCTGFYYPEHPASEETESGGNINDWRWVGIVTGYDQVEKRLFLHSKNKIAPGMMIEFLAPGQAPITITVPDHGILDAAGEPVAEINNHAKQFSMPCDYEIPTGAMIRTPMKAVVSAK